ncbi:MAG: nucleotidyltransferase domain-containing protein [Bryobacter sp.]|nr:nucleotidyltransferase domain-containing protein [Bryobacter sp.]
MSEQEILAEIVRRLVAAIDPDKIILFGSRARGQARPESDYDLLIIKETAGPAHSRVLPAYRALDPLPLAKDVLWFTPSEFVAFSGRRNHITARARREGRVLYERTAA